MMVLISIPIWIVAGCLFVAGMIGCFATSFSGIERYKAAACLLGSSALTYIAAMVCGLIPAICY